MRALLVLVLVLSTGCSTLKDVRYARVTHAACTTYDLAAAVRQTQAGRYEANQAVTSVWPAVVLTVIPWLAAEYFESRGNLKVASAIHWSAAGVQAAAGTYSLVKKE